MRPQVLDLSESLRKLETMLRRLVGDQVELHCDFPDALPAIHADLTGVEQVVMNLVMNARDAITPGGRVTVSTSSFTASSEERLRNPDAEPGRYVCVSVTDTGVGMDEATRARIFEPFFTTKGVNKGSGMGLATVYGIAKQHHGWVDVATTPGHGSTFRVFFPVTELSIPEEEVLASPAAPSEGQHTILIVEDDEAVRSLVREVLLHSGYRVLEAESADAAMVVWRNHREEIALLLTDMVMPGSANGLDLAQALLAERPDLKVIYTSGYSTDLFSSNVYLQDGVNYLPKPYLSSKLIKMLENALDSAALNCP
jgi:CheY-like chemotaxis protein